MEREKVPRWKVRVGEEWPESQFKLTTHQSPSPSDISRRRIVALLSLLTVSLLGYGFVTSDLEILNKILDLAKNGLFAAIGFYFGRGSNTQ